MATFWKEICSQVSKVLIFDKVILLLGLCPKEIIRKTVLIDRDIIMMSGNSLQVNNMEMIK